MKYAKLNEKDIYELKIKFLSSENKWERVNMYWKSPDGVTLKPQRVLKLGNECILSLICEYIQEKTEIKTVDAKIITLDAYNFGMDFNVE